MCCSVRIVADCGCGVNGYFRDGGFYLGCGVRRHTSGRAAHGGGMQVCALCHITMHYGKKMGGHSAVMLNEINGLACSQSEENENDGDLGKSQ